MMYIENQTQILKPCFDIENNAGEKIRCGLLCTRIMPENNIQLSKKFKNNRLKEPPVYDVGKSIAQMRLACFMTQKELAAAARVKIQVVKHVEQGILSPNNSARKRIQKVLSDILANRGKSFSV